MVSEKKRVYLEYLVLQCQHKDQDAWNEVIRLHEKRLYYLILQLVDHHHDALNVLQNTWLKAYRSIHLLREPVSLTSWLYRIARNTTLEFLRFHRKDISLAFCDDLNLESKDDRPGLSYAAEQVHKGLKSLSLLHREALVLCYLEDFSLHEISNILSVPIGTVRSRLYYAKRSLRAIIEKEKENERI